MTTPVNILIADDHSVVRAGLRALLERQGRFRVIAEASTGEEAIAKAQELRPDIAVLDVRMPGVSGIEACRQIVSTVPGCRVIILTSYAEDELLFAAIQAGLQATCSSVSAIMNWSLPSTVSAVVRACLIRL